MNISLLRIIIFLIVLSACQPDFPGAITSLPTRPSPLPEISATPSPTPESRATVTPTVIVPASLDSDLLTGRIVFSHEGDVYTMDADGSDRRRLTDHPELDFDP
ncbi:MAG TPA: hypothetical protein VK900_03345, partial [Anaerolineales bacterium]|nr:hypothetical protein [Anaerolineales bacterium]